MPRDVVYQKELGGEPLQLADSISEGIGGSAPKRLPRLFKIINALLQDGRLDDVAWQSIDRELEYILARGVAGRLGAKAPRHLQRMNGQFFGQIGRGANAKPPLG